MRYIIAFGFFVVTRLGFAQESPKIPEMSTDRPSQGNGASTVRPGYFQFESGFLLQRDATNSIIVKEYHLPETLIRVGILKFAELRISSQLTKSIVKYEPKNSNPTLKNTGLDGILLGTKLNFLQNKGIIPTSALQAEFRLPVGSAAFKGKKAAPKLRLNFENKLTDDLSLNYNIGIEWEENQDPFEDQTFNHIGLYTFALNYNFTSTLSGFVEAYGYKVKKDVQQSLDAGIAYELLPNLQLDIYSGIGLSEEVPDFFVSTGISFRLPE